MHIKPFFIRLEASTICQLKCPSCPTASGEINKKIGGGFLKFEDFKKIVDRNKWVCGIELSNWGEIFLNPNLSKIIEYAYQKKVALYANNGANFNTVKDELLEDLVKYRFRSLSISIDGATQEVYSIYRKGGYFGKVIENIGRLNYYKNKYKSEFPQLNWQYVVFGHNEQEIEKAKTMAKNLNMRFSLKLSWDSLYDKPFSPVMDKELVRKKSGLGVACRKEFKEKYSKNYMWQICMQLWNEPQINFDGKVLGCCINYRSYFGNAFDGDLNKVLNSDRMNYARQMLLGGKKDRDDIPCVRCELYKEMKEKNRWLKISDIKYHYFKKLFDNKSMVLEMLNACTK